jgi:hypothetical protein
MEFQVEKILTLKKLSLLDMECFTFVTIKFSKGGWERMLLGTSEVYFTFCPKLYVDFESKIMEFLVLVSQMIC